MRMKVSVIRERREGEHRVILTPREVARFCDAGFALFVEQGAGLGVGYDDADYIEAGAEVVSREEAWDSSLVLKYKPPLPEEWRFLRPDMHLGAIFHAEGDPKLVEVLLQSGVTAYSYEFFQTEAGDFPLAAPGGEIAGRMAVMYGAYHLQRHLGGSGVLLMGATGARKAKVVIIGYGNVGRASSELAHMMGADVVILIRSQEGLARVGQSADGKVRIEICSRENLRRELIDTDLLIGAILISTYDTSPIVDDELVQLMPKGSMIVDVTCGYGSGYLPSFDRPTDFNHPVYEKHGVLHCKIDRLPAAVPVTTTEAYATNAFPHLLQLAEAVRGGRSAPIAMAGKIVSQGEIVHLVIQGHMHYYRERGNA